MLAASFSGMTLANAGLGAVHGLAGPIGAFFDAPHGLVCARLLAPITACNMAALQHSDAPHAAATLAKYAQVAELLTGEADLNGLVQAIEHMIQTYVPQRLSRFGLTHQNITPVLQTCRAGSMLGNPLVLSDDDLISALHQAI
jgi:alcohol dehydrogenase